MTKVGDLFTQEIFTPSLRKVQDLTQLPESTGSNLQFSSWLSRSSNTPFLSNFGKAVIMSIIGSSSNIALQIISDLISL